MILSRFFSSAKHGGQLIGRQVGQLHARLVQHQFMFVGAVACQVDKHQVFRPAAFGEGLHRAAQASRVARGRSAIWSRWLTRRICPRAPKQVASILLT